MDWKLQTDFLKNHIFLVLRVHKNDPMALVLRYVVDSDNVNLRVKFWLMSMFYSEVRGKIW